MATAAAYSQPSLQYGFTVGGGPAFVARQICASGEDSVSNDSVHLTRWPEATRATKP
jgi:hypothetical protein